MVDVTDGVSAGAVSVLQRIRAGRSAPAVQLGSACELCGEVIGDRHGHLVDIDRRGLLCACRACYLLFTPGGSGGGRFRAVPERYRSFPGVRLSPAQWEAMQIPVSVAFFFLNSVLDQVAAFYPSPAGATESLLPLETWSEVLAANPELATLAPDVEALLVRVDPTTREGECFLVPIDACYELVGQLRLRWKGFDGGTEARRALDAYFADVRSRAAR
jgi:hypothetical protein